MMTLRVCPRCEGKLFSEEGQVGGDIVCLQCGYRIVKVSPEDSGAPLPAELRVRVANRRLTIR